nr:cryptic protein [Cavia porcellus]
MSEEFATERESSPDSSGQRWPARQSPLPVFPERPQPGPGLGAEMLHPGAGGDGGPLPAIVEVSVRNQLAPRQGVMAQKQQFKMAEDGKSSESKRGEEHLGSVLISCLKEQSEDALRCETVQTQPPWELVFIALMRKETFPTYTNWTGLVSEKMTWRHHVRSVSPSLSVSRLIFLKGSHGEKHKGGREVSNVATPELRPTALPRALDHFRAGNASCQGWRPRRATPHPRAHGARAPPPRCCRNGGTCVLGSFCVCPAHFTGRYCEHDQRRSDCSALSNGAWTIRGCRLCRCLFGALHCLPNQMPGRCDLQDLASQANELSACGMWSALLPPCIILQGFIHP